MPTHALRITPDALRGLVVESRHSGKEVRAPKHRCQRRAQLVRHGSEEEGLPRFGLLQQAVYPLRVLHGLAHGGGEVFVGVVGVVAVERRRGLRRRRLSLAMPPQCMRLLAR